MRGKIKLRGNMAIAMKLPAVIEAARKRVAAEATTPSSSSAQRTSTTNAAVKGAHDVDDSVAHLKSKAIFDAIREAIDKEGDKYVAKVNGIIRFKLSDPDAAVLVDLKNGKGSVRYGDTSSKADLTLLLKDEDMVALANGKLNPQTVR